MAKYTLQGRAYLIDIVSNLEDDYTLPWSTYPCIEWGRSRTKYGYGKYGYNNKIYAAHQEAYKLVSGPIPDGHYVCHHCDNPPCFRPIHLFCGTPTDNNVDMDSKGRSVRVGGPIGSKQWNAKLTEEDIIRIRELSLAGFRNRDLAPMFGVNQKSISMIVLGITWKHVRVNPPK